MATLLVHRRSENTDVERTNPRERIVILIPAIFMDVLHGQIAQKCQRDDSRRTKYFCEKVFSRDYTPRHEKVDFMTAESDGGAAIFHPLDQKAKAEARLARAGAALFTPLKRTSITRRF